MPKTEYDFLDNRVLSILSKGESGSGKSIASCGKEFRPVYVFDFEDRMRSVINYYRKLDGHAKDIVWDTFSMGDSFHKIDKQMDDLAGNCPYKTVVAATLSSYVDIILVHLINEKRGKTRSSGANAGKLIGGINVNELEDFNAEDAAIIFELVRFLKLLQSRGTNVILEAHVTVFEEKDPLRAGATRVSRPIVTKGKKAPPRIPGYFDEAWHFYTEIDMAKRVSWNFTTAPTDVDYAKTSNNIKGFDWTNKDLSVELMKQFSEKSADAPRSDPNAPKIASW